MRATRRLTVLAVAVALMLPASLAFAGPRCGGHGKGEKLGCKAVKALENTENGVVKTITSDDAEVVKAIHEKFKKKEARWASKGERGCGCKGECKGDCKGKGECGCKGECKGDCKGKGECGCKGKGECGCKGKGHHHGDGHHGKKGGCKGKKFLKDAEKAVEYLDNGVRITFTIADSAKVKEMQELFAEKLKKRAERCKEAE